uniref:Uncharacterized protein n=1 Tax=Cacopsylla melanoneura TaxID=428564 RepID=A0A8D8ZHB0_9HEMI
MVLNQICLFYLSYLRVHIDKFGFYTLKSRHSRPTLRPPASGIQLSNRSPKTTNTKFSNTTSNYKSQEIQEQVVILILLLIIKARKVIFSNSNRRLIYKLMKFY